MTTVRIVEVAPGDYPQTAVVGLTSEDDGSDSTEAKLVLGSIDAPPLAGDLAVLVGDEADEDAAVVAAGPVAGVADPGEVRIPWRDSAGAEAGSVHGKNDGSLEFRNASGAAVDLAADGAIKLEAAGGAKVELAASGAVTISNSAGSISISAAGTITINGVDIAPGGGSIAPVSGVNLVTHIHATNPPAGPSGPPIGP